MTTPFYLNSENWEGCDVRLVEMDNRLWVASFCDDNYSVSYVDARQLYKELKEYFEMESEGNEQE